MKKRAPPPPSPTPDYLQQEKNSLKPEDKLYLSKSISSLVTDKKAGEKVRLEKKTSGGREAVCGEQSCNSSYQVLVLS